MSIFGSSTPPEEPKDPAVVPPVEPVVPPEVPPVVPPAEPVVPSPGGGFIVLDGNGKYAATAATLDEANELAKIYGGRIQR